MGNPWTIETIFQSQAFFISFLPPKGIRKKGGGMSFIRTIKDSKVFLLFSSVQEHGERGRDGTAGYKGQGGRIGMAGEEVLYKAEGGRLRSTETHFLNFI
jgi:hypothetical protein